VYLGAVRQFLEIGCKLAIVVRRYGGEGFGSNVPFGLAHNVEVDRRMSTRSQTKAADIGMKIERNGFERPTSRAPGFPAILEVIL
jgi:hypothetical protein